MRQHLLGKSELIYLEVFITNFQHIRPPIPHNSEFVYKGPQQRVGSPTAKLLSVAQSYHAGRRQCRLNALLLGSVSSSGREKLCRCQIWRAEGMSDHTDQFERKTLITSNSQ